MPAIIRPWRPEDTPGAVHVVKSVFDEYGFTWEESGYHADLYDIQSHYIDADHEFWVAEEDRRIVGTVALETFPRLPGELGSVTRVGSQPRVAGADCSLERLYVLKEARRTGLGGNLVRTVLECAAQRHKTALEMWSDKRFGDAHRLYARFGAEVVGERICHDPDQSPEWGLLVRLAAT